ncbi:5'-3' exonuclease [Allorhodopirellula heiligendammensis]|uniref:DNA polymerase I n=1 Tax=Allorhodopirellula heiligendammensis TaxID=2714739 RepID=A0A5C6C1Z6_9BACT|nr:5'-3' exonuclease H3TH domain-containing protein [Allorhodopirellula heiligendammensis]TWU18017.1 DNA polymerase I [Allorhodopirellula heiligendammensis]
MNILIDGNNMVHRDFHATKDNPGRFVPGIERRIAAIRELWKPIEIVVAFDSGRTFRHDLFAGYKAGRTPAPEVADCLERAMALLLDLCVPCVAATGFEADDVIATLARRATLLEQRAVIVSADKDLHQCIVPGSVTQVTAMRRSGSALDCDVINADRLQAKYGVTPAQWVDYRVMIGDKSDGIDGIKGVGPATAREILKHHAGLDEFFRREEGQFLTAKEKAGRRLVKDSRHRVARLRQLLTLDRCVPLGPWWTVPGGASLDVATVAA